jgi:hypothetical protein
MWVLNLVSQHRGRKMLENRILRKILLSEKEEVRGGWRKSLKEEFHELYLLLE